MLILRLFLFLVVLLLALGGVMYVFTRDRRYLDFIRKTLRFTVLILAVFVLLYVLEHFVLVGWRVLV
ncbi:MAG: hypothetical protein A2063_03935 [Gallionellales bacterium GWA2_60_142]|nr:MAG: hypothetical protein A2063_03935 [Gallionellales bacterium GWA2_60_142]HCI14308.1 hypothetical protein [Gallionellaceae bacterium]